jgi:hypothetical protein
LIKNISKRNILCNGMILKELINSLASIKKKNLDNEFWKKFPFKLMIGVLNILYKNRLYFLVELTILENMVRLIKCQNNK